jgi:S-disulfanyl-L-cysteine oxidoreductase SoxD
MRPLKLVMTFCVSALIVGMVVSVYAQQRSITEGVYSAAQAARGKTLYAAQCESCHGSALEGASGPPLAGDLFLSTWSRNSLTSFVDKIQKTMPFGQGNTLSRQESADLTAYILEFGKFPAGRTDLSESTLPEISFPASATTGATPAPTASGGLSLPPPAGNLAQLMRAIAFPNSNIIFNLQLKDPGKQPPKDVTSSDFDYVEWGANMYAGWLAVDQAAIALIESTPLLLTPGRRCQNGRLAPVDRADWKQYVSNLLEVSKLARSASEQRNFEAFTDVAEKLYLACDGCHKVYRDNGLEGSGANRCE